MTDKPILKYGLLMTCSQSPDEAHCWHAESKMAHVCCWCGARATRHGQHVGSAGQSGYEALTQYEADVAMKAKLSETGQGEIDRPVGTNACDHGTPLFEFCVQCADGLKQPARRQCPHGRAPGEACVPCKRFFPQPFADGGWYLSIPNDMAERMYAYAYRTNQPVPDLALSYIQAQLASSEAALSRAKGSGILRGGHRG